MIRINSFAFNDFQINTYVLFNDNNECIIIDPGCYYESEKEQLKSFITKNKLNPILLLNTHGHIDHILGNAYVKATYNIPIAAHADDEFLINSSRDHGTVFGLNAEPSPPIDKYVDESESIKFGNEELKVLHVPGHSPGSVAVFNKSSNLIIVGDVLFNGSIGRTDLPGGDYNTLINSIKTKLFTLDDKMVVHPGHGPSTTITIEKQTNPFLI